MARALCTYGRPVMEVIEAVIETHAVVMDMSIRHTPSPSLQRLKGGESHGESKHVDLVQSL